MNERIVRRERGGQLRKRAEVAGDDECSTLAELTGIRFGTHERGDFMSAIAQRRRNGASDITRSAGDEDSQLLFLFHGPAER